MREPGTNSGAEGLSCLADMVALAMMVLWTLDGRAKQRGGEEKQGSKKVDGLGVWLALLLV